MNHAWHFEHTKTAFGWRWVIYRDGIIVANSTIDYATPAEMKDDMRCIATVFAGVVAIHTAGVKPGDLRVTDKEPQ